MCARTFGYVQIFARISDETCRSLFLEVALEAVHIDARHAMNSNIETSVTAMVTMESLIWLIDPLVPPGSIESSIHLESNNGVVSISVSIKWKTLRDTSGRQNQTMFTLGRLAQRNCNESFCIQDTNSIARSRRVYSSPSGGHASIDIGLSATGLVLQTFMSFYGMGRIVTLHDHCVDGDHDTAVMQTRSHDKTFLNCIGAIDTAGKRFLHSICQVVGVFYSRLAGVLFGCVACLEFQRGNNFFRDYVIAHQWV